MSGRVHRHFRDYGDGRHGPEDNFGEGRSLARDCSPTIAVRGGPQCGPVRLARAAFLPNAIQVLLVGSARTTCEWAISRWRVFTRSASACSQKWMSEPEGRPAASQSCFAKIAIWSCAMCSGWWLDPEGDCFFIFIEFALPACLNEMALMTSRIRWRYWAVTRADTMSKALGSDTTPQFPSFRREACFGGLATIPCGKTFPKNLVRF